jgi:1-aminocyclopropane-1-carboxylate deaminase/D-cysteine desulfhydrase-like pyridoxal-dependent ACC family enzyme
MIDVRIARFAAKLDRLPQLGLTWLPTPLEPLNRLSSHLGGPKIWVKREDATRTGTKTRPQAKRSENR